MLTYSAPQKKNIRGKPTKFYYCRVFERETGRRTWRSTGCTSKKAAEEWKRSQELHGALGEERSKVIARKSLTFQDALKRWLDDKEGTVSEHYFKNLRQISEGFWIPWFGSTLLGSVSSQQIQKYLRKRKTGILSRDSRPLSPTSVNDDLRDLRTFFNWCIRQEWLGKNPAHGVNKYSVRTKSRTRFLTKEEEEKLLSACRETYTVTINAKRNAGGRKGGKTRKAKKPFFQTYTPSDFLYPLVLIALRCGFRRRTLLKLRWRDIRGTYWHIPPESMKTKETYEAPIPKSVLEALEDYKHRLAEECNQKGLSEKERLSPDALIFNLSLKTKFRKQFLSAAKRAGLPNLTFHDLRRVFLNRLRERGASIETAMALSGHRSLKVVMDFYRQVPEKDLKKAVESIDK